MTFNQEKGDRNPFGLPLMENIDIKKVWPTLEGRLKHPLLTREQGLKQLKDAGFDISKAPSQKEIDEWFESLTTNRSC